MEKIMVDTSAIYALLDRSDRMHEEAKNSLIKLSKEKVITIITNFIRAESHALISSKLGHDLARKWLGKLIWPVERITEIDENRAVEIINYYTDKTYSFTDATTFAAMERLGITRAFTFERQFIQHGFGVWNNLL